MPATISSNQLSRMKAVVEETFTSTATHKRPTLTSDGRGGQTKTMTTLNSTLVCRVAKAKEPEQVLLGERVTGKTEFNIYVAEGCDLKPKDQLVVDSMTLELVEVYDKRSINLAVLATATRIR